MTTNTASLGAGDSSVAPVRAGEVVAGKYLIEQTLGVGGMGVVVAARDQLLERRVAIKFLLPKLVGSETSVQRFLREARAATRITSEHVVRLLEIEKLPTGTPFFVMEYLEGRDLRALLRERGALLPSLAVDYALQALQAVAEGHVKGIVHRDIKPSNLFLTQRADGTPLIKVLDFGIAKTIDGDDAESTSLTSSDDVRLGSPAYMPPEQLQNPRDVDKRADIWSLGATLYELLCGRPPFEGPGYLELASRILSQPPTPLAQQRAVHALPTGLERVVRRCLEKDRNQRFANARELAMALAPFGSDDARVSLTRVSGLLGSTASFPALSRAIAHDADDCEPTLDVAGDARPHANERHANNVSALASISTLAASRRWSMVALAASVIVFGLLLGWLRFGASGNVAATRSAAALVEVGSTVAAARSFTAQPAPLPPSPQVAQAEAAAAAAAGGAGTAHEKGSGAEANVVRSGAAVATKAAARRAAGALSATGPAQSSVRTKAPAPVAVSDPPPAGDTVPPGLGRSDAIERLIERRH